MNEMGLSPNVNSLKRISECGMQRRTFEWYKEGAVDRETLLEAIRLYEKLYKQTLSQARHLLSAYTLNSRISLNGNAFIALWRNLFTIPIQFQNQEISIIFLQFTE